MTDFTFQNKEYEVKFQFSCLVLYKNGPYQDVFTCYINGPTSIFADLAIRNPNDSSNDRKGKKLAFERAARKLASHLWKKGGPRPHHIKNAIISCYNDAVLKETNPELWEKVQVKKTEQKKTNDAKRLALKEENARIKKEKRLERGKKEAEMLHKLALEYYEQYQDMVFSDDKPFDELPM